MKKFTILKSLLTVLIIALLSLISHGQGHETFTNLNASSASYTSTETSYIGNNGATWYHIGTRLITAGSIYEITGVTCGFGDSGSRYVKTTVTGGVGEISFKWRSYFTGGAASDRTIQVLINGTSVGSYTLAAMGTIYTETITINTPGTVVIQLRSSGTRQIAIDDIVWTDYSSTDPILIATPVSLSGLNYVEAQGPSGSQSYKLSGTNLDPSSGDVTVSTVEYMEVSSDNVNFGATTIVSYNDGTLNEVDIYVRLKDGLAPGNYNESITNSGGSAANVLIAASGIVTPAPAPLPELTMDGYSQDFATFLSAETFPNGWTPSNTYAYGGDFGTGTSGGLRGNNVLGFQLTASSPNNVFKATLTLVNKTGQTLEELEISYLGKVARTDQTGTPKWVVSVNGVVVPELEFSTEAGVDQLKSFILTGLNLLPNENIIIEWSTTSTGTSGTRRQIGIADVEITPIGDPQVSTPTYSHPSGTYFDPFMLNITTTTEGATIFYRYDELDPWTEYTEALAINSTITVFARGTKTDFIDSGIASASYFIPDGNIISVAAIDDIEVFIGTLFEDISLPSTINVTLDDAASTIVELIVNWAAGTYDENVADTYNITGEIVLKGLITNTSDLTAQVNIIVIPIPEFDIISVESIEDITVAFGTLFEDVVFPEFVTVELDDASTIELEVIWEEGLYNESIADTYAILGNIQLTTGINNPSNIQAIVNVIVLEEVILPVIVSVEALDDITVDFGTTFAALPLPSAVEVTLDDASTEILNVIWEQGTYNGNVDGTYTLEGVLQLTASIENPENIKASIDVIVSPEIITPEAVTIVGWTFPVADARGANLGIESNIGKLISREPAYTGTYTYPSGVTTQAISSTAWASGLDSKYWIVEFSTVGHENLTLNSVQQSSNTGPRDFKVQYKVGSGEWTDIENSNITVANNLTAGVLSELPLPQALNNKAQVKLRWIMRSNVAVSGTGDVAAAGTSRIDNIMVKGYAGEFPVTILSVASITPIQVEIGTAFDDIVLPESVSVTLDNLTTTSLNVVWQEGDYDGNTIDEYTIFGDLVLTGTITNPGNLKAQVTVFVVDEIIPPVNIASVEVLEDITVEFGTSYAALQLPPTVTVTLENEEEETLNVIWAQGTYNGNIAGTYTLFGTLQLIVGIENPENLKASVNVTVNPLVEPEVIVGWTFPVADNRGADLGLEVNIGNEISRDPAFAGTYNFYTGVTTQAASTSSWADGSGVKYWYIEFSTIGYGNLTLSSAQRSSNTGPKNFKVEYKIGSGNWTEVEGSTIVCADNFTSGILSDISLPEALNNKNSVALRWVMTSNIAVGGAAVASAGASRIDNILIKGLFSDEFKRIVTQIEILNDIIVDVFTTTFEELELPETVLVYFDDEGSELLPVTWSEGDFDGDVVGEYILEGTITLGENMENPSNIKASIKVIVREPIILYTVVFNVDMSTHPNFNAATDLVYIRGDMNGWGVPGTNNAIQLMTRVGESLIYTKTFELEEGTYEYKYYKNAGTSGAESGENRSVEITEDVIINDIWLVTNITELFTYQIKIYPNPASDYVFIKSDSVIEMIELYDLNGRSIKSLMLNSNEYKIDLSALNNGMYIIKIYTGNNIINKKVILNK
ncbi:MAG: Ig-like domain-containing protein [Bacteroidetes bacterium]|nr:Ig-like domain-containing protein [Bacteroidota bacterium]